MEQRFTIKDFFLFTGLAGIAVVVLLAMYQVDRQWGKMAQMERMMAEQAGDLRDLRRLMQAVDTRLTQGAAVAAQAPLQPTYREIPAAFQRAHEATLMEGYAPGDWLVMAFGTNLKTITPLVSSDVYASQVQGYVLESLLTRNPQTLKWEGLVAQDEGWTVSPDGLTITFSMRPNVKFSDGKPLTAEDVAFTFDFIMNEAIAAPRERAYFEKIERVSAIGPNEVVFKFKEPYFDSLALAGGMSILPRHFYAPYLDKPEDFNQSKGLLLGSGPYRLKDPKGWTPDLGYVELERNPYYWGPVLPPFTRLLWKIIENDSARLTTFRNGEIDVYNAQPREYQTLLDDTALIDRTQHLEYLSPTAGYSYIGWNQQRKGKPTWFADKRVRQAMTYLTDQERIIKEILLGFAEPAVSPFSPRSYQHDPSLKPRPFDLIKARQLLTEAGFADRNGDGVLEDSQGSPFQFELVYFQDNDETKQIVLLLKDLYARAGILLQPKPTEWSVMIDLLDKKDFDAITLGWSSGVEVDIYQMFHSSQTLVGGDNYVYYVNPEFDQVVEQARASVDEAKRMPLWQAAERILYEDQPYTFMVRRQTLAFIDKRMHNVQITQLGLNLSVPVEWFVPAGEQKYAP